MKTLDERPARTDLTDRECAKFLGGMIGMLVEMADVDTVRDAVKWWAENDAPWDVMKKQLQAAQAHRAATSRGDS